MMLKLFIIMLIISLLFLKFLALCEANWMLFSQENVYLELFDTFYHSAWITSYIMYTLYDMFDMYE